MSEPDGYVPTYLDMIEEEVTRMVSYETVDPATPLASPDTLIMLSIAVSLRRIADAVMGHEEMYGLHQMAYTVWDLWKREHGVKD